MKHISLLTMLAWSAILTIALVTPAAHGQVASLSPPPSPVGPYDGDSLKVFVVGNLYDESKWQQIENYTASDFDIAGTFSKGNFTYVVLERVGLQ